MINTIKQTLLAILAADPRLFAGGNDYPAGWQGVRRVPDQEVARGYVNLYGTRQAQGSIESRPAIFLGTPGFKFVDKQEFETCSQEGRLVYRVVMIPVVICAMNQGKGTAGEEDAESQCFQLDANVRQILFDPANVVAQDAWYDLTVAEDTEARGLGGSSTGSSGTDAGECVTILPIEVHYSFRAKPA